MYCLKSEKAAAFIELALVLPFIVLVLVATVEFSRVLRVRELMTTLGSEAAKIAFRECSDLEPRICGLEGDSADGCLSGVRRGIDGLQIEGIAAAEISISLYRWDDDGAIATRIGVSRDDELYPGQSEYDENRVTKELEELVRAHDVIAIAEIYYDYKPLIPIPIAALGRLYDVTIF